jgi:hypothetical protein
MMLGILSAVALGASSVGVEQVPQQSESAALEQVVAGVEIVQFTHIPRTALIADYGELGW